MNKDRNPVVLWKALSRLCSVDSRFAGDLRISFIGQTDISIRKSLDQYGLSGHALFEPYMPHDKVLKTAKRATLLLPPLNKAENAKGRIPGKLFEYLRSGKPIPCLGPEDSDVGRILQKTGHGQCFRYDDYTGIRRFIEKYLDTFFRQGPLSFHDDVSEYSSSHLVGKLSSLLNGFLQSVPDN